METKKINPLSVIDDRLLYREEVYAIIGAAMEVLAQLGRGFVESVYQEALAIEFTKRGIPYLEQKELVITYKGKTLEKRFLVDFLLYNKIILEIKAVEKLTNVHEAQLLNYLKASGISIGLLVNFNSTPLEWRRRIFTK